MKLAINYFAYKNGFQMYLIASSTKTDLEGVVPLHVGSQVFISKRDILRIMHNDSSVYTGSLSEIVFGRSALLKCAQLRPKDRLYGLNLNYLNSIITHVVSVFKSRNEHIDAEMVKTFILRKINEMEEKHKNFKYILEDKGATTYIQYSTTQRGRVMLIYNGYRYVENRQSHKNIFWRCSRYVKYGCRATVVTSKVNDDVTIRVAGSPHTHEPEVKIDGMDDLNNDFAEELKGNFLKFGSQALQLSGLK